MRISDWSSDLCSSDLVHHVVEADSAEQAESLIDFRLRELAEPAPPEADVAEAPGEHVLHHREALDQRVLLEDHAHAPARPPQGVGAERRQLQVTQEDLAAGRLDQAIDAADQRGLAGARGADEGHDLAVGDAEIDALQGEIAGSVALLEVLET